jgi:hypothetical protein
MFRLTHTLHDHVSVSYDGLPLFRYVYDGQAPVTESPRPYFHPLYTLAGDNVTLLRPHDHRWHHGLSLTVAALSGQNFWGGNSYVRGQGYVLLDNHGRQQHRQWADMEASASRVYLKEWLSWLNRDGEEWISEERRIEVSEISTEQGYWVLALGFRLRNVRGEPLVFGSPATEGRPGVGYGGLFWRGIRAFSGGRIMLADGAETSDDDMAVMGRRGAWLAFVGQHDGPDRTSTLLFIDHPDNPRYPTQWFARTQSTVCVSYAFMFDQILTLPPGDDLTLNYRIVVANGAWPREQIEAFLA